MSGSGVDLPAVSVAPERSLASTSLLPII